MVDQGAVDHFLGGIYDRLADLGVDGAQLDIGLGGGLFLDAEGADQRGRHALSADLEVLERTLGLSAPVPVGRYLNRTEAVGLCAKSWRVGHGQVPPD